MADSDHSNEINVAKYIISQTPIGHLTHSLENLTTLIGEEVMDTPEIKTAVQNYTEDHLSHFPNDSKKLVVSKLNKDSNNTYYDQSQGIKFTLSEDCKEKTNIESCDDSSSLRQAIDASLQQYKEKYYKPTVTTSNVFYDETTGNINIIISAHNINMKNFWSGEWLSTWVFQNGKLTGTIKANTYYYEEGNIQFNVKTEFNENVSTGSDESTAKDILKIIEKKENDVQMDLEKVYDNFSDHYIKPLRRKLPITGTKMNWNLNQIQYGKK